MPKLDVGLNCRELEVVVFPVMVGEVLASSVETGPCRHKCEQAGKIASNLPIQ